MKGLTKAASEFLVICVIVILSSLYNNTVAPQRKWGTSIQPLKKLTANHPPRILKSNK
jgi:hypothetical protein